MTALQRIVFTAAAVVALASMAPAAVLTQCPPAGAATGCQYLVTFTTGGGSIVATGDGTTGTFGDDYLVGFQNNTGETVTSVTLGAFGAPFLFDGDGACSGLLTPTPNPCGPLSSTVPTAAQIDAGGTFGYAGPNTTFSSIASNRMTGTVIFTGGLANGASAWVSLEGPSGGAPFVLNYQIDDCVDPQAVPEPGTWLLMGAGLTTLAWRKRG